MASGDATKVAELVLLWSGSKPERALSVVRECVSLLEKEVAFSAQDFPAVPSPPTTPGEFLDSVWSSSVCLRGHRLEATPQ